MSQKCQTGAYALPMAWQQNFRSCEGKVAYGRKASCAWKPRQAWGLRGCRCRLHRTRKVSITPSEQHTAPPNSSQPALNLSPIPSLLFSNPNGPPPSLPILRKKAQLTSPHAASKAASGNDRARSDGAPGDSGNSATGEHFGAVAGW